MKTPRLESLSSGSGDVLPVLWKFVLAWSTLSCRQVCMVDAVSLELSELSHYASRRRTYHEGTTEPLLCSAAPVSWCSRLHQSYVQKRNLVVGAASLMVLDRLQNGDTTENTYQKGAAEPLLCLAPVSIVFRH